MVQVIFNYNQIRKNTLPFCWLVQCVLSRSKKIHLCTTSNIAPELLCVSGLKRQSQNSQTQISGQNYGIWRGAGKSSPSTRRKATIRDKRNYRISKVKMVLETEIRSFHTSFLPVTFGIKLPIYSALQILHFQNRGFICVP